MNKIAKFLTFGLSCVLLTSCDLFEKPIELTGVEISLSSTECEVDSSVEIQAKPIPSDANKVNGEKFDSSRFKISIEDQPEQGPNRNFYPRDEKDYTVFAYYDVKGDGLTSDDLVSNKMTIHAFFKEEDKKVFIPYVLADGTVSISPGKLFRNVTDMVIPAEVDGYKVSRVSNAFNSYKNIKSLRFEKNVSKNFEIPEGAFKNCTNLKYVSLPYQVTKVGQDAFTNIAPDSKIFVESSSRPSGFYYLQSIWSWNGGAKNVYYNCKDYLETDDFVFGISPTNDLFLVETKNRESDLVIPEEVNGMKVVLIARNTFADAPYIRTVQFPETLTEIEDNAFNSCTAIEVVRLPKKLTYVGEGAFYNCSNLKLVVIPQSVQTIKKNAFEGLNTDVAIFVENSVIPSGFYYESLLAYWHQSKNNVYYNCKDYYEDGDFLYGVSSSDEYYLCKYFGRESSLVLPGTVNDHKVTVIAKYCFANANFLTSIVIPENVEYIEKYAFSGCISLRKITLPKSLISLGEYTFENDSSLENIIIPYKTEYAGERCFYGCTNLRIFVCVDSRPKGFSLGGINSYDWNASVKATYYGYDKNWHTDDEGNPIPNLS